MRDIALQHDDFVPEIPPPGAPSLSGDADEIDRQMTHAEDLRHLQAVRCAVPATPTEHVSTPVWSAVGSHRPVELTRSHLPAFLAGEAPRRHACGHPFVRTHDWYLLTAADRAELSCEQGTAARLDLRPTPTGRG